VKLRRLNAGPDHLSRITNGEEPSKLEDNLSYAKLFSIQIVGEYFVEIIDFFSTGFARKEYDTAQENNLVVRAAYY